MNNPLPQPSAEKALVDSLRAHLEGLRRTPDGEILYKLIARGLQRFKSGGDGIEQAFIAFLHSLLERYATDPESHPSTRVKARLIQQRLIPYLAHVARNKTVARTDANAAGEAEVGSTPIVPADARTPEAAQATESLEPEKTPATEHASPVTGAPVSAVEATLPFVEAPEPALEAEDRMGKLQEDLAQHVTQTLASDEDLGPELDAQAAAEAAGIQTFVDLKQLFLKGLDELINEREELKRRLGAAGEYLRAVDADRKRLRGELSQARKHGAADELTGLPKREIFVRALEAEVGRVTRYGFSLALALLDLDGFTELNEQHGREAGDAVLRCYARDILSHFRTYDLVGRYGDDEFVVLFPNTQQDGAQRALEKARRAAAEACLNFRGATIPLPSFSSVLTIYVPGEPVPTLLARAQTALHHAKQRPGGSVVALAHS